MPDLVYIIEITNQTSLAEFQGIDAFIGVHAQRVKYTVTFKMVDAGSPYWKDKEKGITDTSDVDTVRFSDVNFNEMKFRRDGDDLILSGYQEGGLGENPLVLFS